MCFKNVKSVFAASFFFSFFREMNIYTSMSLKKPCVLCVRVVFVYAGMQQIISALQLRMTKPKRAILVSSCCFQRSFCVVNIYIKIKSRNTDIKQCK